MRSRYDDDIDDDDDDHHHQGSKSSQNVKTKRSFNMLAYLNTNVPCANDVRKTKSGP